VILKSETPGPPVAGLASRVEVVRSGTETARVMIMKLSEIIEQCAGTERTIADVYRSFAERWPDPPLGDLWRVLAEEEVGHGVLLDNAARLPAADREESSIEIGKLDAIRARVIRHIANPETTIDDALSSALDLEELELENVYRRLLALTADDSRMASAFRGALGQFSHHEQRLIAAIDAFAKTPALRERGKAIESRLTREGRL
jgi:rubrerythrin